MSRAICNVIAFLILAASAQAQNFTAPAPHHKSACVIQSRVGNTTSYGSGVYIQAGNMRAVLTCAHLFDCENGNCPITATVIFSDGTRKTGHLRTDKYGHDVAMIHATHPTIRPLSISGTNPTRGQVVEYVTYGGAKMERIRHFRAIVSGTDQRFTQLNATVVQGDSGGGILNTSHQVIGIQSTGERTLGIAQGHYVFRGGASASLPNIRAFVARCVQAESVKNGTQICYQCQPQYQVPRQGGLFNRQEIYVQPQPAQQQQPNVPQIDYNDLFPPAIQQPATPTPPAVQPQQKPCNCPPQAVTAEQYQALTEQLARLREQIANQPAPTPIPAQVTAEQHQQLQAELSRLQQSLETLANRPIQVDLLNQSGEVIQSKNYPAGKPIRLQGVYKPATKQGN